MSVISSIFLPLIVYLNIKKLNFHIEKAKKIYRKGYFLSFLFYFWCHSRFAAFDSTTLDQKRQACIAYIFILFSVPVAALVFWCLNYLPRIAWTKSDKPFFTFLWRKYCLHKNSNFIIYWLVFFCILSRMPANWWHDA